MRTGADYLRAWAASAFRCPFNPTPYLFLFGSENCGKSIFYESLQLLVTKGVIKADRALPDGWDRRPLGRCARFLSGGTPSKGRADFWEGSIPWVSSGELTEMRVHDASLHVTPEAVEAGSRLVPPDTILAVVRGMSLAKDFRVAITARSVAFNQDLKALVSEPDVDATYLFMALHVQRAQIRDRATEASHGTKKLDTPVLASVPILIPRPALQQQSREIVDPMNAQWDNLHQQNDRLKAARDLLLPRLINGGIAV